MFSCIYLIIIGFQFLDKGMIVATSDRMKGHGKQSYHCFENDQSILYFNLPENGGTP